MGHIKNFSPPKSLYNLNIRDRNTLVQPKILSLASDTIGHIQRENHEVCGDL